MVEVIIDLMERLDEEMDYEIDEFYELMCNGSGDDQRMVEEIEEKCTHTILCVAWTFRIQYFFKFSSIYKELNKYTYTQLLIYIYIYTQHMHATHTHAHTELITTPPDYNPNARHFDPKLYADTTTSEVCPISPPAEVLVDTLTQEWTGKAVESCPEHTEAVWPKAGSSHSIPSMCVCTHVCVCMCIIYACVRVCLCVYACICACMLAYVCVHLCMCT